MGILALVEVLIWLATYIRLLLAKADEMLSITFRKTEFIVPDALTTQLWTSHRTGLK